MSAILVTAFEPFGSFNINPSMAIARMLEGEQVGGRRIDTAVLPVSTRSAADALASALDATRPEIVVSLGLAGGRARLSIERVGLNVLDFSAPDNDGSQPTADPIVPDGPDAYLSTLPVRAIATAWRDAGIPGAVSNSAGTYLCNKVLYLALHSARERGHRAGFIHVPLLPEQAAREERDAPSMSLETMVRGVTLALEVAVGDPVAIAAVPAQPGAQRNVTPDAVNS